MPSAFLQTVFDSPSMPAVNSYDALYSFSDDLISIKEDPDAFVSSPFHYQGLDALNAPTSTPSREPSANYCRDLQPQLEADFSTDSNSTACPETPPCQTSGNAPRHVFSNNPANSSRREESTFLREILTAYDEASSPVRPVKRRASLQISSSHPKVADAFAMRPTAHSASSSDKWIEISNEDDTSPFVVRGWSPPPEDPFPLVDIDLSLWESARVREVVVKEEVKPAKSLSGHSRSPSVAVPASKEKKQSRTHQRSASHAKDIRSIRQRPSRPKKQAAKAVSEASNEPPMPMFPADNANDDDLDMNVDIPSYIYPPPRLARRITQHQAEEERTRANLENAMLQEQFRAEDQALLHAVGTYYSSGPGHQSFVQGCVDADNHSSLATTI